MNSWHVGIAAEAFAAGIFARFGFDVSVQYGANQPEYDLIISRGDKLIKVSVKGSNNGEWGLTQKYLRNKDYHLAADNWLQKHSKKTIFCLVQFQGIEITALPRIYLATPSEIAIELKKISRKRGYTKIFEKKVWDKGANGYGTTDQIPKSWEISEKRIIEIFKILKV